MAAIEVLNLTKRYGARTAVDDITFTVGDGEVVGFLGPNGAGKSTTLRILTCFQPATAGTARVAGYDVFKQGVHVRENMGYLPENTPLYPEMRVEPYLKYRATLKGVARRERKVFVESAMERCHVTDVRKRIIGHLSKGYRQRVGLADALVHRPKVLILDEPTSGLDPNQVRDVRDLIKEISGQTAVLFSTHTIPWVEQVCERVLIINQGAIVRDATLDSLRAEIAPWARIDFDTPLTRQTALPLVERLPGVIFAETTSTGEKTTLRMISKKEDAETVLDRARKELTRFDGAPGSEQIGPAALEDLFASLTRGSVHVEAAR